MNERALTSQPVEVLDQLFRDDRYQMNSNSLEVVVIVVVIGRRLFSCLGAHRWPAAHLHLIVRLVVVVVIHVDFRVAHVLLS